MYLHMKLLTVMTLPILLGSAESTSLQSRDSSKCVPICSPPVSTKVRPTPRPQGVGKSIVTTPRSSSESGAKVDASTDSKQSSQVSTTVDYNPRMHITITQPSVRPRAVSTKRPTPRYFNRLQLLLGVSKSEVVLTSGPTGPCCGDIKVQLRDRLDIGLQYLRDFGNSGITGSIIITRNESAYIGLGVNW